MFKKLSTKLTLLYTALFVLGLGMISVAVYVATTRNVEHVVRGQLTATGAVFQNLDAARVSRLRDEANILANDFGFRAAVATGDDATIRSALSNLSSRFSIDLAVVVMPDGAVKGRDGAAIPPEVVKAVLGETSDSGVFIIHHTAYEAVAAPIKTPMTAGWVLFANSMGGPSLSDLQHLSALPLKVALVTREGQGRWLSVGGRKTNSASVTPLSETEHALDDRRSGDQKSAERSGNSIALVRELPGFGDAQRVVLLLSFPLADALRPYSSLVTTICIIGALGVLMLVAGSWFLAGTLTRPISALDRAARGLRLGETARVEVTSRDEIARLSHSFNAMADDIQEREASLTQARDVAEAANRAKNMFLANMNHEVRTPLNGVLGVAGMLAATPLDADQRQMVELIEASGEALQRILNNVLDMVDLGAEGVNFVDAPFDLGLLAQDLAAATGKHADSKNLEFVLSNTLGADNWVIGDRARVAQILTNLLENAIKFTSQGQIELRMSRDAATGPLVFEICDTGVGFDSARAEDLFTAFSQVDGSMTRKVGGTGLGLSLARDLARAMGGEITADSRVGQGSVFRVTLPLVSAEPPDLWLASETHSPSETFDIDADGPRIRVLLAEDHPANRKVVEMILAAVDVELVSVENGAEAVSLFKEQAFDVVLMDLQMPVMDGLTAIGLIRAYETEAHAARTPIIVLSANVQAAHLRASADAGADCHLAKPIMAPTLIKALEDAICGCSDLLEAAAA